MAYALEIQGHTKLFGDKTVVNDLLFVLSTDITDSIKDVNSGWY